MNDPINSNTQTKLASIEAIEMALLGLLITLLSALASLGNPEVGPGNLAAAFVLFEGAIFLMWGGYNLFIRLARAGGPKVDVGLWVIATAATASVTFWGWTVLDINRLVISKLFYRGAAPVEYAWSSKSKQRRKEWEAARKAALVTQFH
jgi:drug/metabolite transporter (DMT)-like permease